MERTNTRAFIKGLLAAIACVVAVVTFNASTARAGAVLISRDSTIRAAGTAGAGYDLHDGSQSFEGFSDLVDTADAGLSIPRVAANQNSRPAVSPRDGGFMGAYAEGSATIDPTAGSALGASNASSTFNLTFEIKDVPSLVSIGGAVGLSGDGATTLSLTNKNTKEVVLQREILVSDGHGQSVEHQTTLNPGIYELAVEASANAEPDQSMAYYTLNLSVSNLQTGGVQSGDHGDNGGGGVHAVPLPPAVFSAGMLLGTGGFIQGLRKWRRNRATALA
jgi:hypothetical protein